MPDLISSMQVKIFADGADKQSILELARNSWISGFTTNPSLMRKAGITDYESFGRDLTRAISDRPFSFEVLSDDFDEMEQQALRIASWGANVYVKIPITNTRGESAALFLNHHGTRLTRQGFWLIMKAHARAAGIEDISPHSLRHAFALDLIEQGLELRIVQERLGHANRATTLVYRQAYDARAEQVDAEANADGAELLPAATEARAPAACEGGS